MKKKLVLNKSNNNYIIEIDNGEKYIEIINKKIKGKEIFDKVYQDFIESDDLCDVEITTELTEKKDQIIFQQLKNLFEKINAEVNKQLTHI